MDDFCSDVVISQDVGFPSDLSAMTPLLLVAALVLGFAAQGWINQLLSGKQGLGAFLSDGSGYQRSGFKLVDDEDRAVSSDPLPWLKLPKLDFVEVAGQEQDNDDGIVTEFPAGLGEELRIESMRRQMKSKFEAGDLVEAERIRAELEELFREENQ